MKCSIVTVSSLMAFLALAGCSDDTSPSGTAALGQGGNSAPTGGSAGSGQAGQVSGGSGGGNGVAGGAGSIGDGGASGSENADASTPAKDASGGSDATTDLDAGDWKVLFNGQDLTGFTPSPGAAALFAVDMAAGEAAIHVYPTQADQSDQPQATLRTNDSYISYVYHEEYKWGTKRFGGRKQTDRDNGLCFHVTPPLTDVWPTSIEFQLGSQAWPGDWVSGNIFMLVDKTRAQWPNTMMNGQSVWSATGTKKSIGAPASYFKALAPSPNQNKGGAASSATAATEWNVIELTVHGSKDASYSVNGVVVNGLTDMEYDTGNGTFAPLDHGPLALQAEFAEIYFRNIKIRVLP
jgi:Domain of Unknown Function (DUF1080)